MAASVEGQDDVALRREVELGEDVHLGARPAEPVEHHDCRVPAGGRRRGRLVERRGEGRRALARGRQVLLREGVRERGRGKRERGEDGEEEPRAHGPKVVNVRRFYNRAMDPRPVGVFDSGVGGLTVLHECLVTMPHEDFVYLGDHARLPYGPRPLDEVRAFALEIGSFLERQGVKLVVAACNTATSAALPQLQEELRVPVIGVIAPEAHAAVQATRNRRVGLMATEGTVAAGRYAELVHALDAGIEFVPVACPDLVPLIEADELDSERCEAAMRSYAQPLKEARVDTVILGCTHYPLLKWTFQRVFGRSTRLVFSADETAREVAETLAKKGFENSTDRDGDYRFLTTGEPASFRAMGKRFLQLPIREVEHVTLAELALA